MKYRYWFISVFLLLTACFYLFFYMYRLERDRKIQEIIGHQRIHAKQAAKSFHVLFEKWSSVLFYLSKNQDIVLMNDRAKFDLEQFLIVFKEEINGITRTDRTGKIIFTEPNVPGSIGTDISKQKHMVKILSDHKPVVSDVFDAIQGYKAIVIHYPVFKDGRFDGTIAFLLNFTQIAKKILDDIKIGKSGYAWMISGDGIVLYDRNQNNVGKSAFQTANDNPEFLGLVKNMLNDKEGVEYYNYSDNNSLVSNRLAYFLPVKIKNTFWSIAVTYSEDELIESIVDFRNKLIIIFALIFVGGILFSYFGIKAWIILKESEARKKAEENLRENERHFAQLIDGLPQLLWTTTADGVCDYLNKRWIEYTGIPEEEQLGSKWLNQVHEEDKQKVIETWNSSINSGAELYIEFRIRRYDGIYRWFDTRALPLRDLNGKIVKWFGSNTDIQDDIDMREKLKESEERYRSLSTVTSDYMFSTSIDETGCVKYNWVTGAFKNITGYDVDEFVAVGGWRATLHPADLEQDDDDMKKLLNNQRVISEIRTISKKGNIVWVRVYAVPVWDEKKKRLVGVIGAVQDITERKQAEEELQKLYVATEQGPAAVVITDTEGNIEYVNAMFSKISGYSASEILGKQLRILKHAKKTNSDISQVWEAVANGLEWRGEYYNKRKDGTYYWESTLISPIKDNEGRITNFLAIQEDISEKKKTFEELLIAKEKAEQANHVKNVFLANMSHELRTPLIGILGYSEMLSSHLKGEAHEMAKGIIRSGNRLLKTLNLILDLTKVESDKFELDKNVIDLNEEIELAYHIFKEAALDKKLDFKLNISCRGLYANVDEKMFKIILENLISNAIKFTDRGKIILSAGMEGKDTVYIKVEDTGIGIAKEYHDIIFEEFRQVSEGINRDFQGTGLGLSITRKYTEILGGKISLESSLGAGSVFTIRFPLAEKMNTP